MGPTSFGGQNNGGSILGCKFIGIEFGELKEGYRMTVWKIQGGGVLERRGGREENAIYNSVKRPRASFELNSLGKAGLLRETVQERRAIEDYVTPGYHSGGTEGTITDGQVGSADYQGRVMPLEKSAETGDSVPSNSARPDRDQPFSCSIVHATGECQKKISFSPTANSLRIRGGSGAFDPWGRR